MAISNSEELIKIGSRRCVIYSMLFKDEEKSIFEEILKEDMRDGYTTTSKFFSKLIFNDSMTSFLKRNKIEDGKELSGMMKYLNNNIEGHNVFMYYKDQSVKNPKDLILKLFPEKLYRNNIVEVLNKYLLNNSQIHFIIRDLINEKNMFKFLEKNILIVRTLKLKIGLKEKLYNILIKYI